jgi:hypothetical protein
MANEIDHVIVLMLENRSQKCLLWAAHQAGRA